MLTGYDIDGVLSAGVQPVWPYVVISGRTFAEWDNRVPWYAPVAIRLVGEYGDRQAAGEFKATMINLWKVDRFYEDDPVQIAIIRANCPSCEIVQVTSVVNSV